VEVPKKITQAPFAVKRGGGVATTKRDNAPNKRPKKRRWYLFKRQWMWVNLWLIDTLWIFYNLALKCAIETRMIARRKTLMISYWGIMRHQRGYKRFSSTILVPEKYMIIVLQLSTHTSRPSLLIQILRPW
jgi:hypothetical protein